MTTLDPQAMEQQVRDIEQLDAVVFHGVSKFPTTQTVVLPKLVIVLVRQGRGKLMFDNTELSVSANDVYILPAKHIFSGTFTSFDHEVTMLILSDKLVEDAQGFSRPKSIFSGKMGPILRFWFAVRDIKDGTHDGHDI